MKTINHAKHIDKPSERNLNSAKIEMKIHKEKNSMKYESFPAVDLSCVCCHVSEYFFQLCDVRIFIQAFRLGFDVWISVVIW